MKIAIDGMGGDNSPSEIVKGSVEAASEYNVELVITGPEKVINEELSKYTYDKSKISIINSNTVIKPDEHATVIRSKKDSSLVMAVNELKSRNVDAVVSAGGTGPYFTACQLLVGRIKGINRAAIAPVFPGKNGNFIVIDVGANAECKPINLVQFGLMGSIYMKSILGIENPKVGLINIGAEEEKGNELTKEAHKLLRESKLNFIGNVEPRDIPSGDTEVLVCDGFTGNIVLKLSEGMISTLFSIIKREINSSTRGKIGGLFLKPTFSKIKSNFSEEEVGGSAFLGVDGICIKAHGNSNANAFKHAIRQAVIMKEKKVVERIREESLKYFNEV